MRGLGGVGWVKGLDLQPYPDLSWSFFVPGLGISPPPPPQDYTNLQTILMYRVKYHCYLGLWFTETMSRILHVENTIARSAHVLSFLKRARKLFFLAGK